MKFFYIVLTNIIFGLALFLSLNAQQINNLRDALLSSKVDSSFFQLSPDELGALDNFFWFDNKILENFKTKNVSRLKKLVIPEVIGSSSEDRVKKLVLSFSRNGIEGGCGKFSNDLIKNTEWIIEGGGCCSDHAQVFTALALINNIQAREVHHGLHTFNEYWDQSLGKWVWVDPQFAIMARNDRGEYLNLLDIHNHLKSGMPVSWVFFGSNQHVFSSEPVSLHPYYQKQPFSSLVMTLGNNVFQENQWNQNLWFLPKPIRQYAMYLIGIKPGYAYFEDPLGPGETFSSRIKPYLLGIKLYLLVNAILFFWWLLSLIKSRTQADVRK